MKKSNQENKTLTYIWNAIIQERTYQDAHKGIHGKNKHDIPGWILIIKKQLDTAAMEWLEGDVDKSLAEVLQATAVGVACLQQHGVPDAALRIPIKKDIIAENEERALPTEIDIVGFERFKTYTWDGMLFVRTSDFTEEQQKAFTKFMRGQTMTLIPGADPQDWVYLHDFENFLAGGKLFWD